MITADETADEPIAAEIAKWFHLEINLPRSTKRADWYEINRWRRMVERIIRAEMGG